MFCWLVCQPILKEDKPRYMLTNYTHQHPSL